VDAVSSAEGGAGLLMVDNGGEEGGLREIANSEKEWSEIEWKRESARGWIQRGKTCNFRMQKIFMKYLKIFIHSLINLIANASVLAHSSLCMQVNIRADPHVLIDIYICIYVYLLIDTMYIYALAYSCIYSFIYLVSTHRCMYIFVKTYICIYISDLLIDMFICGD